MDRGTGDTNDRAIFVIERSHGLRCSAAWDPFRKVPDPAAGIRYGLVIRRLRRRTGDAGQQNTPLGVMVWRYAPEQNRKSVRGHPSRNWPFLRCCEPRCLPPVRWTGAGTRLSSPSLFDGCRSIASTVRADEEVATVPMTGPRSGTFQGDRFREPGPEGRPVTPGGTPPARGSLRGTGSPGRRPVR